MKIAIERSLGFADIIIYDNGIFHVNVLFSSPLSLNEALVIEELRINIMGYPLGLILATSEDRFVILSDETLEFMASHERNVTIKANAVVLKSLSQRLFTKSSSSLKKVPTPMSYFGSEDKAIEWLLSIKDE